MEVISILIMLLAVLLVFVIYHIEHLIKEKEYFRTVSYMETNNIRKEIKLYTKIKEGLIITLFFLILITVYLIL